MKNTLKYTLVLFVVIFSGVPNTILAQKKYFIYIQAEDKQPFYVMINKKNYSSSLNGHLIIPKLKNGKYFFVAGFPKDKYPEQKFTCVVEDKDQGFVLKQFGSNGWGLFNLITFKSTMANAQEWEKEKSIYDTVKIDDDIAVVPVTPKTINSNIPSAQSSINQRKETITGETNIATPPKFVSIETEKNGPEAIVKEQKEQVVQSEKGKTTSSNQANSKRIIRTEQKGSAQGLDEIYVDFTVSPFDTISIFIPMETSKTVSFTQTAEGTIIDSTMRAKAGNATQYNTTCIYLANESDYTRTRKSMSFETTDDKMIIVAKKTFKGKCYTVEQIKNLGLLFLAEQSRLKFFNAAKPHVYDTLNFTSLETQFTLSTIIEQFRKLNN